MPEFLAFNAGTTVDEAGKQVPYAFHVEANVMCEPFYSAADDVRQSFCLIDVVLGRNPWLLLGENEARREYGNANINENRPFATLILYGELADKMRDTPKGAKILFSGWPRKEPSLHGDETESEEVNVYVDSIMYLSSRAHNGDGIQENIQRKAHVYTRHHGGKAVSQWCTLTGTVKNADDVARSDWDYFRNFRVDLAIPVLKAAAIANGECTDADYGNDKTLFCAAWGYRATQLNDVLREGNVLALTGALTAWETECNGHIIKDTHMNVYELSVIQGVSPKRPPNFPRKFFTLSQFHK